MDPTLLQQFRQQLATWIETRLESQRLPFQRLELCPRTLTERGRLIPDLVLWINRDSQLAGSMILLPDTVDEQALTEGASLAKALGLGHFTTWAAREVSIWELVSGQPVLNECFDLPPANRITPADFQNTLDDLLERLKVVTVTSAPPTAEYSEHYFANLCLRNLQELTPGLTISARITAGKTAADEWVEQAPREKAWICLWRMLFLLQQGRLPPGLQPERLEFAIQYALDDLVKTQLPWLAVKDGEPPLPDDDAVRLHHLVARLRQLGWPRSNEHAEKVVRLLLDEQAHRFSLKSPQLPWSTDRVSLRVNCHPPRTADDCSLIAPRPYLAGWAFNTSLKDEAKKTFYAETLESLDGVQTLPDALAVMNETDQLDRKQRDARMILLRQVWPSRRFELPRNTPAWLWDTLYLIGLVSNELSLLLPPEWQKAPGIQTLWSTLAERYQLAEISVDEAKQQALYFTRRSNAQEQVLIHLENRTTEAFCPSSSLPQPGTTQLWLKAEEAVMELLRDRSLSVLRPGWAEGPEPLAWGAFLFLQTRLGQYIWTHCSDQQPLPSFEAITGAIAEFGVPLPGETLLADLALAGSAETGTLPDPEQLEREFTSIFGPVPELAASAAPALSGVTRTRRRSSAPASEIASKVFRDGIPRFPEHYLMGLYRPALTDYDIKGPLDITEEFFDKISLQTAERDQTIEVSGKIIADALILASYTNQPKVALPNDEQVLAQIVEKYRADLEQLRDNLVRECRRCEPHRQAAIKLAEKIWQQQNLPPERVL